MYSREQILLLHLLTFLSGLPSRNSGSKNPERRSWWGVAGVCCSTGGHGLVPRAAEACPSVGPAFSRSPWTEFHLKTPVVPAEQYSEATSKRVVGRCAARAVLWGQVVLHTVVGQQSQLLRLGVLVRRVQGGTAVPPRRHSRVPSHQARVLVLNLGVVFCHAGGLHLQQLPTLM